MDNNILNDESKNDIKYKRGVKKKTKIILVILFLILIKIIYDIISPFYITPSEIKELNKNIDLPYEFGKPLKDYKFNNELTVDDAEMSLSFETEEGDYIWFSKYPDYSCSYKFTTFNTSNSQISFFGITVGDSMEKANNVLDKNGYKLEDIDFDTAEYTNGRVEISIDIKLLDNSNCKNEYIKNGIVRCYSINIYSTDWFHKGNYK
jgi:hypothetical protein